MAFSACMHGSRRNQRTCLLSSPGLFSSLAVDCDNRHEHLPWTVAQPGCSLPFAAAREAEYPPLLCARMAHCLQAAAHADGYVLDSHVSSAQRDKHLQGRQTVKSRPLVPEFKDFLHVPTEVTQPGHRLLATPHARETQPEWPCDSDGDGQPGWPCDADGAQPAPIKRLRQMYKYGVQWSPQEFFAQAKQVLHPRDPQSALLDCTKQAIFDNLTMSAVELAKLRLRAVLMIKGVVSDLEDQERQLKASMEPGVSAILSSKKILAWQALLEASHYEDMQVVELVKQGITLDGVRSCPPCYPDWKPATLDSQDLLDTAVWRRRVLVAECDGGDTARQQDVHETTLASRFLNISAQTIGC